MLNLLTTLSTAAARQLRQGRWAAATIVSGSGSVPRQVGTTMLVSENSQLIGSLSGGCVEAAVIHACHDAIESGTPRREHFGFTDGDAFAVGLSCGGVLEVLIQPIRDAPALLEAASQGPAALIRRVDNGGHAFVNHDDGGASLRAALESMGDSMNPMPPVVDQATKERVETGRDSSPVLDQIQTHVRQGTNGLMLFDGTELFVETLQTEPIMYLFGANDFTAALADAAKLLGFRVTLCDARPIFITSERFPSVDRLVNEWPDRFLKQQWRAGRVNPRSVICVMSHDAKFDIPLLRLALSLDVAFVGAMGSRVTHAQRQEMLQEAGVTHEQLAKLHSPIGLGLGAETPQEVAVSVLGEIIAERNGRTPKVPALRATQGSIHFSHVEPVCDRVGDRIPSWT
ncbi:XdhC/CoxI family protein [Arthrobacter sp. H5]|uniref:XdhC family protein n=1 Tax=Arthrobacter sp. H5 TaxID=1267973 RepID=UPI0004B064FF|nr:XdhC/CoxI family protein [Arthrobacter sp. H5]